MNRKRLAAVSALGIAVLQGVASATTYTVQRIGVQSNKLGTDSTTSEPIDTNAIIWASRDGNIVGTADQYVNGTQARGKIEWLFNGTQSFSVGLYAGLDSSTGVSYQRSSLSYYSSDNSYVGLGNSRIYNNGYVTGIAQRYDSAGNSLGSDAYIFNGNGATASTPTITLGVPSTLFVPTSSASGSAPSGVSSSNLAYNVPSQFASGGTLQQMGGSSGVVETGAHGNAAGQVTLYYNTTGTTWVSTATDAFYYDGTTTKTIGLVDGNNVSAVGSGSTKFTRTSTITRINDTDQVLGYSSYFGGSATTTATGNDIWLYDPANATGTGANGTTQIAPTATGTNFYANSGTTAAVPTYLTNSGIVGAQFQQYAAGDTARVTALSSDAFLYNSHTTAWTQVGLTGAAYTFYSGTGLTAKSGIGGSGFANINYPYAPPVSESGQAAGFTTRTASATASTTGAPVTLGQDAWVYYPSTAIPLNGTAGTTQVGLTGGVYEQTNSSTGLVTRSSTVTALTAGGQATGTSNRYNSSSSTTSAGTDTFVYDPAHGISTSKQIGLFGTSNTTPTDTVHEYLRSGFTNITRQSSIVALGGNGLVGGAAARFTSAGGNAGSDAWVYDPLSNKTYSIDPNSPTSSATTFSSVITSISDSGLVLGYDGFATTGFSAYKYQAFDWYLGYNSSDSVYDIPTFQYLTPLIDSASLATSGITSLFTEPNFAPFVSGDGKIVGLAGYNGDTTGTDGSSAPSYVPFQISPVPEPTSLAVLLPTAALMLGRRKKAAL